ncbi:MAG: phosphoribosylanthranilate isomerase [Actinomycetota bacterium]
MKICGITRLEDAQAAVDAGASAIGFVFAASPRRVEVAQAAAIRASLPGDVGVIGVFVDGGVDEVLSAAEGAQLDGVQLQGAQGEAEVAAIRAGRPGLFITRAVRLTGPSDVAQATAIAVDAVMVDSKDAHHPTEQHGQIPVGWLTGIGPTRLIVAGGLGPSTVGAVVSSLRPWGVDVSSGVEVSPGRKDPALIRQFLRAVREAELVANEAGVG